MFIKEPSRDLPVAGDYDVIVVGGGIAGIAAALASARSSAKTLLIEKTYMLGGLATAGLVTIYLPLCDGMGRQVSFGIAEELLRLSVKHGFETACGQAWGDKDGKAWLEEGAQDRRREQRFEVQFNANLFALLCEELLRDNGVHILYGTTLCATMNCEKHIKAIITENVSGRQAYTASSFVDATGDAALCALAGAKTRSFQQGNVLASWYYEMVDGGNKLHMLGACDIPDKYKIEEDKRRRYSGLDGQELSDMVCDSHINLMGHYLKGGGITPTRALANIATIPQVRMTRCLVGKYTQDDTEAHCSYKDSIGMISDWRKRGPVYEIPFGALYGNDFENMLVCGRCISVTDSMWDISRVIPPCAVTGQAAGTAAAMKTDMSSLSVRLLQEKLQEAGVRIHMEGERKEIFQTEA